MKNLALLSLIFLFACNQPAKQQADPNRVNPAIYCMPGGTKVVFLTDYYADYLKAVKSGIKNLDSLYRMKIGYPIFNKYFATSEYADYAKYEFSMSISDTTGLAG